MEVDIEIENFINRLPTHKKDEWEEVQSFKIKSGLFGSACLSRKTNGIIKNTDENGMVEKYNVEYCIIKTILKKKFRKIEPTILKILSNDIHSMKYYGSAKDDTHVYIYMEYCQNVISLDELLLKGIKLNEDQVYKLFRDMALALKNIHANGIAHRDIKDEHLLFLLNEIPNKNDSLEIILNNIIGVKLIDFGISKLVIEKSGSKYYSQTGTEGYIAPEVKLRNNRAGRKSDVYSLGCILIRMVGGDLNIKGGIPEIPKNIPDRLKNIIQRCIAEDPDARFNSEELYNFLTNKENKPLKFDIVCQGSDIENLKSTEPYYKNVELIFNKSNKTQTLLAGSVPMDVECVKLTGYNGEVEFDAIPSSVKYLDLGNEFDIKENGQDLPTDTVKTLVCGFNFTSPINSRNLPHSITDLQLYNYNQPINKNSIPSNVSYLTLGNNFTHFE